MFEYSELYSDTAFSYRPHSSRAVRRGGGQHGTVFWRISCLLSGREEHLRTLLCLLLQVSAAWEYLPSIVVNCETGAGLSHAPPVPVTRSQLPMNMCVVRVGEFLMNMMMFDPMGFGRGTPNVFRYGAVTAEHVSIFVRLPDKVKQCLLTIIPCLYIDMFDVSLTMSVACSIVSLFLILWSLLLIHVFTQADKPWPARLPQQEALPRSAQPHQLPWPESLRMETFLMMETSWRMLMSRVSPGLIPAAVSPRYSACQHENGQNTVS